MKKKIIFFVTLFILLTFVSTVFADYTRRADNTVPAYKNEALTQRTGNERVDAGDVVTVHRETNRAYYVTYPVKNGKKTRWVPKNIFNASQPALTAHNPEGNFDGVVSNSPNQITVTGWAADRDNMGASLQIHVYVGGGAGSGAEGYAITANKSRPDVHNWFANQGVPAGEFYGFNETINVKRTGNQPVYVYAINVGGGNNVELGHKTVNIKAAVEINNTIRTLSDSWYQISPTHDLRRVLDVNGGSTASGANIMMYSPHGGNNQKFYLQNRGSGWFSLKVGYCDNYITADGNGAGANLSSRPWTGSDNQLFKLVDGGGGSYHVISKVNQNLNFDCAGGWKNDGVNVQLWTKENNSAHHKWRFTSTSAPSTTSITAEKKQALRTVDAYEYSSLQGRIGRVDKGDMVIILEESANAYRVEYPTSKGAKYGWVTKDILNKPDNRIEEAMKYIASLEGRSMDYDGAYGAQCVDLIKYYYRYFGVANYARGNAKEYSYNTLPPGWQRIKGAEPQKGDILVYTTGGGGNGHVAIAESPNLSWHQNYNGKYVKRVSGDYRNIHVGYWGVIRPVF